MHLKKYFTVQDFIVHLWLYAITYIHTYIFIYPCKKHDSIKQSYKTSTNQKTHHKIYTKSTIKTTETYKKITLPELVLTVLQR